MKLIRSISPHIRSDDNTASIMLDVIIALAPATIFGVILFGFKSLMLILVTVAAAVASEYLYCLFTKKENTTYDLSSVVTGLLLALTLPPTTRLYVAVVGAVFSIVVVKMLFGGIGKNFANPAITGRVFLLVSFPAEMTKFTEPFSDVVASATPLTDSTCKLTDVALGMCSGSIGETSAILLLLGGAYLLWKRVISLTIPLSFMVTVALIALFAGQNILHAVFAGGVVLGAVFMATDYVTSPMTKTGKIVFGIGCGFITMIIRLYGSLPEGVSYGILIMNILTPFIDKGFSTTPFGVEVKEWKKKFYNVLESTVKKRKTYL